MARDPLHVVLRLRRIQQDAARAELAESVRAEANAAEHVARLDARLADEAAAAELLAGDDVVRAAYPVWLAHARSMARDACAALDAASGQLAKSRMQLADARAATRVVEALLARHDDARREARAREEQRALDEAGSRRTRSR